MEQEIYFKVLFYFKIYFIFTKWEKYYIVGPLCYKGGQVKGSDYYKVGQYIFVTLGRGTQVY